MRLRWPVLLASFAVCAALTALAAWLLDWSFQRAATVLVVGAAAFLVVLWSRVLWESIRTRRRR